MYLFSQVCERFMLRVLWISFSGGGSCLGSIFIAILADLYGRRPAMLIVIHFSFLKLKNESLLQSIVTMALGAFLETFADRFWLLCAFTFLNSFGKWAVFQVNLVTSNLFPD